MELSTGALTMPRKHRFFSLVSAVLACASLASPVVVRATDTPKIHPKKIELLYGVVTGTRTVPAYAAALGASTSPVGELYCSGLEKITDSTIFRVETASHYFDLLKWCNGSRLSSWDHWEQLHVSETIVFRVVKEPVRLSIKRCQDLGLLSKAQVQLLMEAQFQLDFLTLRKIYNPHCTYSVKEAYVKIPDEEWTFRIVGSGPRSQAKNRQVGAGYTASLPPPW